jgi:bifunctional non-homologous end joining protein LigD
MSSKGSSTEVKVGRRTIHVGNPDKALFPEDGITKADLVEYYRTVGDVMVPRLRGRPVMMARYPDGIDRPGFYQKDTPEYFPDWVHRQRLAKEGGSVTHVVCDDTATLVYLASQACITPHVWLSRVDMPEHPDQLIFDLDPPGDDFDAVRSAAHALHRVLDDLALPAFLKTTGSRGVHLTVPLDRRAGFDTVRAFARDVASVLAAREPQRLTIEPRKAKREGRVFIDTLRNGYAQTAVPPYAVRNLAGAPVAAPLHWDELDEPDAGPRRYTVANVAERLDEVGDPWGSLGRGRSLTNPRRRLDAMMRDAA